MTTVYPVRFVAVGDIMMGRGLKSTSFSQAIDLLSTDLIQKLTGDIVTGNLECLIGNRGTPSAVSHSHFQGDPVFSLSLLQMFDVVTLANNHIGDFGDEAIDETLAWLEKIGLSKVGIGPILAEAIEPATFDIRGCKIAIFGATTVGTLKKSSRYKLAEPGPELYSRARDFARTGHICVLHLHAGGGDVRYPSPTTRKLLDEAADAGFNLVLGHHPHVVQGYLADPGRFIFYSLGDFIFDRFEGGRNQALLAVTHIDNQGRMSEPEVSVVRRTSALQLELLAGETLEIERRELHALSEMIRSGDSDISYLNWRGSKLARLKSAIIRDFQAGGVKALIEKIFRINRRKLGELFFG